MYNDVFNLKGFMDKINKMLSSFFVIMTFSLTSCDNRTTEQFDVTEININPSSVTQNFAFDKKFKLKQVIPISGQTDFKIADIKRIYAIDSLLFVWDESTQSLWRLDRTGKLLGKIGDKGHSENEYINLDDVYIDANSSSVFLLDNSSQKILCFDSDGDIKDVIKISEWAMGASVIGNTVWLESDGQNSNASLLLKTDKESGQVREEFFKLINNRELPIIGEKTFSSISNGEALFSSPYLYSIYSVDENGISPVFHINIEGTTFDDKDLTSDYTQNILKSDNYYGRIKDVFKLREHLFFTFHKMESGNLQSFYTYYNTDTGETILYDYTMMHDRKLPFSPIPIIKGVGSDELYFIYDPSTLPNDLISLLQNVDGLGNLSSESNPVIVVYTIADK